jgi:hypothetical protein
VRRRGRSTVFRYPATTAVMIPQIRQLLEVIATGASDRETINELFRVIDDESRWKEAHDLFSRIRSKTLRADASGDTKLIAQYCFEEICAKAIYNESGESAPFDSDSPFWVVPLALHAARALGIDRERVLAIVAG